MARLFVFIGGLLVLLLTAALVVPPFIDWTGYRAGFEREASRIFGRAVSVNGTASARLLPFPSVTFSDVVVQGEYGKPALTIEHFSMDAELMPFIRGQILIFDMRMEQPHLFAGVNTKGELDWVLEPDEAFRPEQVSLENLTIKNGRITLRDDVNRKLHQIEKINVTMSAQRLTGPWRINGRAEIDGQAGEVEITTGEAKAEASLRLRSRIRPDNLPFIFETDGEWSLEEGQPSYAGQFVLASAENTLDGGTSGSNTNIPDTADKTSRPLKSGNKSAAKQGDAEVVSALLDRLRISGDFNADMTVFSVPEFRMEQGDKVEPYIVNGSAQFDFGTKPYFTIEAEGQQVFLDKDYGQLSKKTTDERTDRQLRTEPYNTVQQRLESLYTVLSQMPVPAIPGNVDLRLPAIIAGGTTIRSVIVQAEPEGEAWNIKKLQADFPGRTQIEAKGRLQSGSELGFDGDFLIASRQPSAFASWLIGNSNEAIQRLPGAGFSGKFSLNSESQKISDLEIVLGETKLSGAFERHNSELKNSSAKLSLLGGKLNQDSVQILAALLSHEDGFSALSGENLDVSLRAGPLELNNLQAEQLDTSFRVRRGRLEFDRLMLDDLEGATITATGSVLLPEQTDKNNGPSRSAMEATLDATVISSDLENLIGKLSETFPQHQLVRALHERAQGFPQLFSDVKLDVIINAVNIFGDGLFVSTHPKEKTSDTAPKEQASGQEEQRSGQNAEVSFSLNGTSGAMVIALSGTSQGQLMSAKPMQLSMNASAKSQTGEAILALVGFNVLPLGLLGELEAGLQLQGAPSEGMISELDIRGPDMAARLNGVVTLLNDDLTASGKVSLFSDDIEPVLASIGYILPSFGAGSPIDVSSDLQFGKGIVRLPNLEGSWAGRKLTAKLDGSIPDTPVDGQVMPLLRGEIKLASLDLSSVPAMLAGAVKDWSERQSDQTTGSSKTDNKKPTKSLWTHTQFLKQSSLPLMTDFVLHVDEAYLNGIEGGQTTINDFKTRLVKTADDLELSELEGLWKQGKISGQIKLNNNAGTVLFGTDLQIACSDLHDLYQTNNGDKPFSGKANVELSLTGAGKSPADIVQSLAGNGTYQINDLTIDRLNAGALTAIIHEADAMQRGLSEQQENEQRDQLASQLEKNGSFIAKQTEGSFSVSGGVLRVSSLQAQNEQAELKTDLQLDLSTLALTGTGEFTPVVAKIDENALQPQLRLSIGGTYGAPQLSFDREPLVRFLTQRALMREQQRSEALQALVIEKQRLKREADYYNALNKERQRLKAAAAEQRRLDLEKSRLQEKLRQEQLLLERDNAEHQKLQRQSPPISREQSLPVPKRDSSIEDLLNQLPELDL